MTKDEIIGRIKQLGDITFNLNFSHEDCKKIGESAPKCEWIKADLSTFFREIWSVSWLAFSEKALWKRSNESLEKDIYWLDKSFFERFPEYTSGEKFITPMLTPKLYEALNMNEEMRKLILLFISAELKDRLKQVKHDNEH